MRTRACDYVNTKTWKPVFGIEIFAFGKWMRCAEDGKPLLFNSKAKREAKRAELRKQKEPA